MNDFDLKKANKLYKKAYDYYYTMAVNCPELLSEQLARNSVDNIILDNNLNKIYDLAFNKKNMQEMRLI